MPIAPPGTNSIASAKRASSPERPSPARDESWRPEGKTKRLNPEALRAHFLEVRRMTEQLVEPLSAEDACAQSMPDASPAKWHLGHTSWFFETFVLAPLPGFRPYSNQYAYLFNSYYEALGARVARHLRGLITRPSLGEVAAYRRAMTERVAELLAGPLPPSPAGDDDLLSRIELGIHHEQQHQELVLTDVKHLLAQSPLHPAYQRAPEGCDALDAVLPCDPTPLGFRGWSGGLVSIGKDHDGFAFDNEGPEHLTYLQPYELATRLVTNGEYLAFMRDGGYERPELWLSDGFRWLRENGVARPLYWHEPDAQTPQVFTLAGLRWLDPHEPVCHVSYYEADAYARWAGARLPSEAEWEHAASGAPVAGNLLETGRLHPHPPAPGGVPSLFGDVWQWTQSAYAPYPGYRALAGALGEYNGKFMCNQMVLKGGSCATPASHVRASYRNFFPPSARWQFTGIRLAKDVPPHP
jgi:ergothioneine biosynthesis protein EgtB